jgi:hypothetical protein
MTYPLAEQLLEHLWSRVDPLQGEELYVILDAARDRRILAAATRSGAPSRCLYDGAPPAVAAVAPYLVRLRRDSMLLSQVADHGWGQAWGIFLVSRANIDRLADHLKQFVLACDDDDSTFYFRYYDPRVFRAYLPTCTALELEAIFGPVRCYLVEHEDPDKVVEYWFAVEGMSRTTSLRPPDGTPEPTAEEAAGEPGEPGEPGDEWVVVEEESQS